MDLIPFCSHVVDEVTGPEMTSDLPVCQPASSLFKRGSSARREQRHIGNTCGLFLVGACMLGGGGRAVFLPRPACSQSQSSWGTSSTLQQSQPWFTLCSPSPLCSLSSSSHSWGLCGSWNLIPSPLPFRQPFPSQCQPWPGNQVRNVTHAQIITWLPSFFSLGKKLRPEESKWLHSVLLSAEAKGQRKEKPRGFL